MLFKQTTRTALEHQLGLELERAMSQESEVLILTLPQRSLVSLKHILSLLEASVSVTECPPL